MPPRTPEINARQQHIIRALLNARGRSTLADLSEMTSLNPRVIRYNMNVVRTWLNCFNIDFINRPGYGVEAVASEQTKMDLLNRLDEMASGEIVLSKAQRSRIILLNLLSSARPLTAQRMAEIEDFSRSTIFKDICEIEEWLKAYHLKLVRRSSKGIWVEGAEESRRFALARLLHEELGDEAWYSLSRYFMDGVKLTGFQITPAFSRFMDDLDLAFAGKLVSYIEENMGVRMSVVSRVEIMVYLAQCIRSIQAGRHVTQSPDDEMSGTEEASAAEAIAYQIEKHHHLAINHAEKCIIAALIKSCKLEPPDNPQLQDTQKAYESSLASEVMAQEIINICSMRLHPMIKIDELLLNELANHLDYAFFRLKHHIPIRNAHLKTLREKYSQIYRVAESSVFLLENEIHQPIPAEEVGYITMYLLSALERLRVGDDSRFSAVIVNDGVRSKSSLLKSRLEVEFPNLKITRVINTFHGLPEGQIDGEIIISTVPMVKSNLPVIQVSPFLEVEDIKNIQRWLADKSQVRTRRKLRDLNQNNSLVDLLTLPHVIFSEKADCWQDIVNAASLPLIKTGSIQTRYIRAMNELIETHGFYMYMGSGVLLLHAKPTDGVNELCISLLKLDTPFHFEDNRIPDVDLIFVLGATDDSSHLTALFQLNELIQFPMFMQKVRQASQPAEVIRTLWQWLPKIPETA